MKICYVIRKWETRKLPGKQRWLKFGIFPSFTLPSPLPFPETNPKYKKTAILTRSKTQATNTTQKSKQTEKWSTWRVVASNYLNKLTYVFDLQLINKIHLWLWCSKIDPLLPNKKTSNIHVSLTCIRWLPAVEVSDAKKA